MKWSPATLIGVVIERAAVEMRVTVSILLGRRHFGYPGTIERSCPPEYSFPASMRGPGESRVTRIVRRVGNDSVASVPMISARSAGRVPRSPNRRAHPGQRQV